MIGFSMDMDER